jgi:acyl carrier protein
LESTEIYGKLSPIFHDVFDDPTIVVDSELSASRVEGWDSLSHVRLMLTVERTFGVHFSASEIGGLKNVGELVQLLQSRV